LFRDFRGRFRPTVSIIEDMIMKNDPTTWRERVDELMYRLTTADVPTNAVERELFHGNLCAELQRVLTQVEADPMTYVRFQGIRPALKFATVAFITQGGFLSYKGELPESAEVAFGRIRGYKRDLYTVIDEPFMFRPADNFFQKTDPGYLGETRRKRLHNTANSTIGGMKQSVGNTIGNPELAARGAAQKAHAESTQHAADAKTHAEGLGNQIKGHAQQVAGSLTSDHSLQAKGHANEAKGDVQRKTGNI
ncbi:hypothetical protein BG000_001579, partial [Podila horticola]